MDAFGLTISIVAPLMGLLLVAATSYANQISGNVITVRPRILWPLASLFYLSFFTGGVLIGIAIWEFVGEDLMRKMLTGWIFLTLLTGILLTDGLIGDIGSNGGEIQIDDEESDTYEDIPEETPQDDESLEGKEETPGEIPE